MSDADAPLRDDLATVVAIAAMAACTSDFAHEALGHGSACLLSGGHITLLNNAFFKCSSFGRYVAAAGPLGNIAAGIIAFLAQGMIPARRPALRLYALLVMAFSLYWEAGYLIQAMIRNSGDSIFAWRELVGPATSQVRAVAVAMGIALYYLISLMLRTRAAIFADSPIRVMRLLRAAWLTGVAVMAISGSLFAPDRLGAVHDAALSIAASFPLLFASPPPSIPGEPAALIVRSRFLIVLGGCVFVLFAATMGRGIFQALP